MAAYANAGLIEGSFTGIAGSGSVIESISGTNSPTSRLSNAGWDVFYIDLTGAGNSLEFAFYYGNNYRFGADTPGLRYDPALTPEEAWNLDKKVDDGKPGVGKILAYQWDACTDAATHGGSTVSDRTGSSYLLSTSSVVCALGFAQLFD